MTKVARTPTVAELQAHAQALADAFHKRLIESPKLRPEEAFATSRRGGIAFCSTIIDETTYAVALHELGHLVAPLGLVGQDPRIAEDAAWSWARHYSLIWTAPMAAVAGWAESTYEPGEPPAPQAPVAPTKSINWNEWK